MKITATVSTFTIDPSQLLAALNRATERHHAKHIERLHYVAARELIEQGRVSPELIEQIAMAEADGGRVD